MTEQQPISPEEKEERELAEAGEAFSRQAVEERARERNMSPGSADPRLEEAEKAFEEENKKIAAQQSGEPMKEETADQNQKILTAL